MSIAVFLKLKEAWVQNIVYDKLVRATKCKSEMQNKKKYLYDLSDLAVSPLKDLVGESILIKIAPKWNDHKLIVNTVHRAQ